jgi:DnaJ family protein C protein 9
MDRILEQVPLCTVDDEDRFRTLLLTAIDRKEIRAYTRFTRPDPQDQIRRRKQADAEAKEAEELAKELGLNEALFQKPTQQQLNKGNKVSDDDEGMAAIKQAIQRRSQDRYETLIAGLEAKYGATKSKSKSTTTTANTNNNNNRQRKK